MERIKLLLAIAFVCQCLACSKFDKQETSYLNLEGNHFVFSEKITTKDAGMLAKLFVRETFPDTKASSESEIKNYESENNLIKVNYAAAGLSSAHVASYFWNEYHKNYIVYNSYPLVYTKWRQHEPYNKYNPDGANSFADVKYLFVRK